jgi:Skp family chaperone for outer membrane proteins
LNCVEEKTVIEGIIDNLKKIEARYWDRTLSSFFTLLVMLMLYNGIKVDQGTREKADEKLKEITGQNMDKDSKQDDVKKVTLNSEKMNKQYQDNIDKLKSELNKERKLKEKMESNLKKYQEEKEKLEKEKKELEKKNKELKEKQRLEEIKNKLNKLDAKITGKTNKKD